MKSSGFRNWSLIREIKIKIRMNDLFGFNQYVNQHYLSNRLNKIHRILLII